MTKKKKTSDATDIIHRRYFRDKPEMMALLDEARASSEIARKLYDLRTASGLSQRQMAKLVGTTASVICRLEDAGYEGHSLAMLHRIAGALKKRVVIQFVPVSKRQKST